MITIVQHLLSKPWHSMIAHSVPRRAVAQ